MKKKKLKTNVKLALGMWHILQSLSDQLNTALQSTKRSRSRWQTKFKKARLTETEREHLNLVYTHLDNIIQAVFLLIKGAEAINKKEIKQFLIYVLNSREKRRFWQNG